MPEGLQTPNGQTIATNGPTIAPSGPTVGVNVEAGMADFARLQSRAADAADDIVIAAPPDRPADSPEDKPKTRRSRPSKSQRDAPKSVKAVHPATPEVQAARKANATDTVQVLGSVAVVAGRGLNSPAFRADGYLLLNSADALGEAAAEVAKHDPVVARMLDKSASGKVTAYMGLLGVAMSLGSQIAANHGLIKPGTMGSTDPQKIIDAFEKPDEPTPEDSPDAASPVN
jgi:hypothetical protein